MESKNTLGKKTADDNTKIADSATFMMIAFMVIGLLMVFLISV